MCALHYQGALDFHQGNFDKRQLTGKAGEADAKRTTKPISKFPANVDVAPEW